MNSEEQQFNNNNTNENTDIDDIKTLISSKETEIKNILLQKINQLKSELHSKNEAIQKLNNSFTQLKEIYETNLALISERDEDIQKYEEKFDSIDKVIQLKDNEISSLKTQINDINTKLKYEKSQRTQNEDYNKFQITKLNTKHQEDLKLIQLEKEKLILELNELKLTNSDLSKELKQQKTNYENKLTSQQIQLNETITKIKEQENIISQYKIDCNDLNDKISTLNNDILIQTKDKVTLENKIQLFETKNQENIVNISLLTQKNKYTNAELEQTKQEITQLTSKTEQYMKLITDLKGDIFSHKQIIQLKEFEIEKEKLNNKLQLEKINDLSLTIENLLKEKTSNDKNKDLTMQTYIEQIEQLKKDKQLYIQQIDTLNQKLNRIANMSVNVLRDSTQKQKHKTMQQQQNINLNSINDDDSVEDAVNFFNNNNNNSNTVVLKSQGNSNEVVVNELKMQLKQKELEIQRITNEFKANEAHLLAQMEEMKNKDNDDVQQYKLIVSNLEMKVEELDKVYNSEKEKIKKELNDSINKLKKENKKLKSEKNKLVQMCSELKIEINRLENNLSIIQSKQNEVFDCIDDDEYFEQNNNNNDNNDIYD